MQTTMWLRVQILNRVKDQQSYILVSVAYSTWIYWISCSNEYGGLILSWTLGLLVKCSQFVFSKGIILVDWCSSELVPLPYYHGRSSHYDSKLHAVTFPRCCKYVHFSKFFPHAARLWNFLPAEYFPLIIYDLYVMPRFNGHLLSLDSF